MPFLLILALSVLIASLMTVGSVALSLASTEAWGNGAGFSEKEPLVIFVIAFFFWLWILWTCEKDERRGRAKQCKVIQFPGRR
jgi:hypothetical protein